MTDIMRHYRFDVTLSIAPPFLSHKSGAQQFGYDMSMLRDSNNAPVFLGSQIRGNLLHTLKYFQSCLDQSSKEHQQISALIACFGKPSETEGNGSNNPHRARLNFSYYWLPNPEPIKDKPALPPRFRIGIDQQKGITEKGNVQVIENLFPAGAKGIGFGGTINGQLSARDAETAQYWLNKALNFLPAIGALKGTGFGRIEAAAIEKTAIEPNTVPLTANSRIVISLKLDRPFCIARPHLPDSNRFVGEDFIPGNAIIGAIAAQYQPLIKDASWFNKMHVRHAFAAPEGGQQRASAIPLSLALYNDKLVDLAMAPEPDKILLIDNQAPAFQIDWKAGDASKVIKELNLPETTHQRHLAVRTAIEENSNQAKDEALFSLECIDPRQDVWITEIDLTDLTAQEQNDAHKALKQILAYPLRGIGKTKAVAELNVLTQAPPDRPDISPLPGNRYIVTLQSQARLFAAPNHIKASGDSDSLHQLYCEYWNKASGGRLSLSHYFARQTRVGGYFYWAYYRNPAEAYQAEWLTQAGSVFVLNAENDGQSVKNLLNEWQRFGLPPAQDRMRDTWQTDPYTRANGFGEIRVNDPIHAGYADYQGGEWL